MYDQKETQARQCAAELVSLDRRGALSVAVLSERISDLELVILGGVRPLNMPCNPAAAALLELRSALELIQAGYCDETSEAQEVGNVH